MCGWKISHGPEAVTEIVWLPPNVIVCAGVSVEDVYTTAVPSPGAGVGIGPFPAASVNGLWLSVSTSFVFAEALLLGTVIVPVSSANAGSEIEPPPDGQAAIELTGWGDGYVGGQPLADWVGVAVGTGVGVALTGVGVGVAGCGVGVGVDPTGVGVGVMPTGVGVGVAPTGVGVGVDPTGVGVGVAPAGVGVGVGS